MVLKARGLLAAGFVASMTPRAYGEDFNGLQTEGLIPFFQNTGQPEVQNRNIPNFQRILDSKNNFRALESTANEDDSLETMEEQIENRTEEPDTESAENTADFVFSKASLPPEFWNKAENVSTKLTEKANHEIDELRDEIETVTKLVTGVTNKFNKKLDMIPNLIEIGSGVAHETIGPMKMLPFPPKVSEKIGSFLDTAEDTLEVARNAKEGQLQNTRDAVAKLNETGEHLKREFYHEYKAISDKLRDASLKAKETWNTGIEDAAKEFFKPPTPSTTTTTKQPVPVDDIISIFSTLINNKILSKASFANLFGESFILPGIHLMKPFLFGESETKPVQTASILQKLTFDPSRREQMLSAFTDSTQRISGDIKGALKDIYSYQTDPEDSTIIDSIVEKVVDPIGVFSKNDESRHLRGHYIN